MQSWVDTHCHIQLAPEPPDELIRRATNVAWMVVPGIDVKSSRAAAHLAALHPERVRYAAGLHPHEADRWKDEQDGIRELGREAAAIGEIGLDFYRDLSPREEQRNAFRAQLELAKELNKPAVVHVRDSFADTYEIMAALEIGPQTILHCWTGGPRWTKRFLELGAFFSFAGPVAFETGDTVRRGAELVPPARGMVETDTPYLAPPPHRGEDNEPAYVSLVGAALAQVWGLDADEVARTTSATAARAYRQ